MNTNNLIFHFSIGPVQGFVAQARRTRDLWAGSFLLSWLSGQAMAAVLENGGQIVFPSVGDMNNPTDEMLKAILGNQHNHPHIGSLPNRFKVSVPPDFDPKMIEEHVIQKWKDLCEAVWGKFLQAIEGCGRHTGQIWERQRDHFWEIQWVIGQDPGTSNDDQHWLEFRKNWRTHWPETEEGDHCVLMHDLQELSGYVRAKNKKEQDAFWNQLRDRLGLLDLRDDERLCTIALVKRLFPKLDKEALKETIGWVPGKNEKVLGNWPSTVYMAAVPWLEKIAASPKNEFKKYVDHVLKTVGDENKNFIQSERATKIESLSALGDLANLDGNFFLKTALANPRATPLRKWNSKVSSEAAEEDQKKRKELIKHLVELNQHVGESASPYFALLLMDGDQVGRLLRENAPDVISQSLSTFTGKVNSIVQNHNGYTIYAGGDDVLAILPINKAIRCALALRQAYSDAFNGPSRNPPITATASTAIIFTHYHNPLRDIIQEAHTQLDDIAKESNGRDSLALALLKSSGKTAEWCATWTFQDEESSSLEPPKLFLDLQAAIENKKFTTGFFYHLRQRYPMLISKDSQTFFEGLNDIQPILLAEYMKSRTDNGAQKVSQEEANQNVQLMLEACFRYTRKDGMYEKNLLQIGGVILARFLAMGGLRE